MSYRFDDLEDGYQHDWDRMEIHPAFSARAAAQAASIARHADRYRVIGDPLTIPWPVIGFLHEMECSLRFDQHLHNGDSLKAYTHQVPKGRPKVGHGPPFTWEESAIDALKFDGLHEWSWGYYWTVPAVLYAAEQFNGFGYRNPELPGGPIPSPYLWSGASNVYVRGKFVSDGIKGYRPNVVSGQVGVALLLREFIDGKLWAPEEPE